MLNLVVVVAAAWLAGGVSVASVWSLILFGIVLAILNAAVKPVLTLLTLPITILTLGLWHLVLNGLLVWVAAAFVPGFVINGFWSAIWFAIVLSVLNGILSRFALGMRSNS